MALNVPDSGLNAGLPLALAWAELADGETLSTTATAADPVATPDQASGIIAVFGSSELFEGDYCMTIPVAPIGTFEGRVDGALGTS
jgi:hypothetical protein